MKEENFQTIKMSSIKNPLIYKNRRYFDSSDTTFVSTDYSVSKFEEFQTKSFGFLTGFENDCISIQYNPNLQPGNIINDTIPLNQLGGKDNLENILGIKLHQISHKDPVPIIILANRDIKEYVITDIKEK